MEDQPSKCEQCIIKELSILNVLNKTELKELSEYKEEKKLKAGEALFEEGETLGGVYCVRNGVSKLSKQSDNGKNQILKLITRGDLVGHRSLISEEKTNLAVTAIGEVDVCFLPKEYIQNLIETNANFVKALLKDMTDELKFFEDTVVDMSQRSVKQRMAAFLLYIEKRFGLDNEGFLSLKLSRADIANIVGTATELCIRTISEFKKKGWIETEGKRLKIVQRASIVKMADMNM